MKIGVRRILALAGLAALLSVSAAWRLTRKPPVSVLVVTIDTLRADRIGAYGDPAAETPVMDRLADRGCLFERCYSNVPLTLPSHCSIFTGTYPLKLNVRDNGIHVLSQEKVTLAEVLKRRGYDTGAVMGAFVLDERFGLSQGFDYYEDDMESATTGRGAAVGGFAERQAEDVTELALSWLDQRGRNPFFLWVHYYDPHAMYEPPEPYASRFSMRPYDGEIAYTDACLGRLLDGIPENCLVVLVADHGESLGEHEFNTHGLFIYDASLRVPLILAGPGVPGGRAVTSNVRTVDIFPTILELIGLKGRGEAEDGISLTGLIHGEEEAEERTCYAETGYGLYQHGWSELTSIRHGKWKYIEAPRPELYNTEEDPFELENLIETNGDEERYGAGVINNQKDLLLQDLEEFTDPWPHFLDVAMVEVSAEVRNRLDDLGYVGSRPTVDPDEKRADPKDMPVVMDFMNILRGVERNRDLTPEQRMSVADQMLALDPNNRDARFSRAMTWIRTGEIDKAEQEAIGLSEDEQWKYKAMLILGLVALERGDVDRALHLFEGSHERILHASGIHVALGRVYLRLYRIHPAITAFRQAIEVNPFAAPDAYNGLGMCYEELGRYDEACLNYGKALEIDPTHPSAKENIERCRGKIPSSPQSST